MAASGSRGSEGSRIKKVQRFTLTSSIAYILFAVGVGIAGFSPAPLATYLLYSGGVFCALGLLCCLLTTFFHSGPISSPSIEIPIESSTKKMCLLLLNQVFFLFISIALFYFLEGQTQANARLHPLNSAFILHQIAKAPLWLGLFPWMLYSILGVGLAYWSICFGRQPLLWRALIWKKNSKFAFFWHNLLMIATDIVTIGPFVFVTTFAFIWLGETVCTYFEWDSLFLKPLRSTFICAILILFFRKSNKQLIQWMKEYRMSVGKILLVYGFVFSFSLVWLHAFGVWFLAGQGVEIAAENFKSPLAGFFSEKTLEIRINLLILGWWIIWIPWMASVVARASVGYSIMRAVIQAMVIPLLVFTVVLPNLSEKHEGFIASLFQNPLFNVFGVAVILVFMSRAWGNMLNRGDVAKGMMLPIGRLSQRPLADWMTLVINWIICYIPGWFVLGWLLLQIMVTLGGIFMTVVIAFFMVTWAGSLIRSRIMSGSMSGSDPDISTLDSSKST